MHNRAKTLVAAMMLAATLTIIDASQALAWRVGNWTGGAFGNRATGRLNFCQMSVRYKSGIVLWFRQYANYNLYVGLSHVNWRLTPSGNYTLTFVIDGREIRRARGVVLPGNTRRIWLALGTDRYTRNRLQRGFRLTLVHNNGTYRFKLTGTAVALARLERCLQIRG
jgi:hypothetical protein